VVVGGKLGVWGEVVLCWVCGGGVCWWWEVGWGVGWIDVVWCGGVVRLGAFWVWLGVIFVFSGSGVVGGDGAGGEWVLFKVRMGL